MSCDDTPRGRAFTLIELPVVISIVEQLHPGAFFSFPFTDGNAGSSLSAAGPGDAEVWMVPWW